MHSADVTRAGSGVRVVLVASMPLRASLLFLRNPDRLVLDLDGVAIGEALAGLPARLAGLRPFVPGVRVSRVGDGTRIVIDVDGDVEASLSGAAHQSAGGQGLVLTLWSRADAPPTTAALAPDDRGLTADDGGVAAPLPGPPRASMIETDPQADPKGLPSDGDGPASGFEELLLELRMSSGGSLEPQLVLRAPDRRLLVPRKALAALRLRLPESAPVIRDGEAYHPIDALRGLSYQLDDSVQALILEAPPALFEHTLLMGLGDGLNLPEPARAPPGAFLNYDVAAVRAGGATSGAGLVELGAFGRFGSGGTSWAARERLGRLELVRLDSAWVVDLPGRLASLRLGDSISSGGQWGRSVRFAGLKWATDFGTQPDLVTFPQLGISGEAVLPSTVDLFVNDSLRLRRQVPEGPFSIQDLPVITGSGEARLVVRDLLGREQVITQPYYASPRLLRRGLQAHSHEIGFVREDYGLESAHYGRPFASVTWRSGLTDRFTGELRGELMPGQQALGVSGTWLMPVGGVFSASAAISGSERGQGGLLALGMERSGARFGFGVNLQVASRGFASLGMRDDELAARSRAHAYLSHALAPGASLGLSYTRQDFRDRHDVDLVNLSYHLSLGRIGFLSLSMLRFLGGQGHTLFGLAFTRPLEHGLSAGANLSMRGGVGQVGAQLQRNLPAGRGFGYWLRASGGETESADGGLRLQGDAGTLTLEAARRGASQALRVGAAGGVALIGGRAFASRQVTDSFALVRVPGFEGVRVYADNQLVGVTDEEGAALVPRIRPYERNGLSIEQADLPLDARIDALAVDAVARRRSGVIVDFPVRRVRGALLALVLEDGKPVPPGARATIQGSEDTFVVGHGGELYLSGLRQDEVRLTVEARGLRCSARLVLERGEDPLPHLGRIPCMDGGS